MIYYYGTPISPNQLETAEGFLICKNVPIARTGEQPYTAGELGLDGDPLRPITVLREEDEVFSPEAMASFEGKPVTDGHPAENVSPENFGAYARGHVQNIRRDGQFLMGDLYINDSCLAQDVQNGIKREISCGYLCDYVETPGGFAQKKIRGNHVAVVPRGRAGHDVAIKDEMGTNPEAKPKGGKKMAGFTKDVLKLFGRAARDAEPEEMEAMADAAATALESVPADKAPEDVPAADEMVEKAPKGDDLGSKLDELLEGMKELLKHMKPEDEEKKVTDEGDIDELIGRLSGETKAEQEDAVTLPAEEMSKDPMKNKTAVEMLKKVRPAVAEIKDPTEKARVTDALLAALDTKNFAKNVLKATQDSASTAAKSAARYTKICADQKSAYDSRNPHKTKKED